MLSSSYKKQGKKALPGFGAIRAACLAMVFFMAMQWASESPAMVQSQHGKVTDALVIGAGKRDPYYTAGNEFVSFENRLYTLLRKYGDKTKPTRTFLVSTPLGQNTWTVNGVIPGWAFFIGNGPDRTIGTSQGNGKINLYSMNGKKIQEVQFDTGQAVFGRRVPLTCPCGAVLFWSMHEYEKKKKGFGGLFSAFKKEKGLNYRVDLIREFMGNARKDQPFFYCQVRGNPSWTTFCFEATESGPLEPFKSFQETVDGHVVTGYKLEDRKAYYNQKDGTIIKVHENIQTSTDMVNWDTLAPFPTPLEIAWHGNIERSFSNPTDVLIDPKNNIFYTNLNIAARVFSKSVSVFYFNQKTKSWNENVLDFDLRLSVFVLFTYLMKDDFYIGLIGLNGFQVVHCKVKDLQTQNTGKSQRIQTLDLRDK